MAALDCIRVPSPRGGRMILWAEKPCAWCGGLFRCKPNRAVKRECCSAPCRQRLRTVREGNRVRESRGCVCAGCGIAFARQVHAKNIGKYCSRDCYTAQKVRVSQERKALRRIRENWTPPKAATREEHGPGAAVPCVVCGTVFAKPAFMWPHKARCSQECNEAHRLRMRKEWGSTEVARAARRIAKARRRAIERGRKADRIDPIRVFDRDGWRCHICGVKTLKSKRGTPHPRAPELDHIVTLADGGGHTWGNVACACRECNATKGASSLGQLGLPLAA